MLCVTSSSSHYLENDYFAIICLEIKCPGWCDKAVGLAHHTFPKTSHQSQRVQEMDSGHHSQQLCTPNKEEQLYMGRCIYCVLQKSPMLSSHYLFHPLLCKWKLALTPKIACILFLWLGVGLSTSWGNARGYIRITILLWWTLRK